MVLKGLFNQKLKFSYYLLTLVPMKGSVKFFSAQKTARVSQEKGVVVISQKTEANGDQVSNVTNKNIIKTINASILLVQIGTSVLKLF